MNFHFGVNLPQRSDASIESLAAGGYISISSSLLTTSWAFLRLIIKLSLKQPIRKASISTSPRWSKSKSLKKDQALATQNLCIAKQQRWQAMQTKHAAILGCLIQSCGTCHTYHINSHYMIYFSCWNSDLWSIAYSTTWGFYRIVWACLRNSASKKLRADRNFPSQSNHKLGVPHL